MSQTLWGKIFKKEKEEFRLLRIIVNPTKQMQNTNTLKRSKKLIDLSGQTFNNVEVLELLPRDGSSHAKYKCRCHCGNEFNSFGTNLKRGLTTSCGCSKKVPHNRIEDRRKVVLNSLYSRMPRRHNQIGSGEIFDLDKEFFYKLSESNCFYCGGPPSNREKDTAIHIDGERLVIPYQGIDRIDSNRGYLKSNSIPCCARCNKAKNDMTYIQFANWITRVYKHFIENDQYLRHIFGDDKVDSSECLFVMHDTIPAKRKTPI